jgi:quinol-cytochrome oxidoreductase complex cytochrome b subunit
MDKLPIHPYFMYKDYFGVAIFGIVFSFLLFFYPNLLGHSDNYLPANPLVTPEHIVPEWYGGAIYYIDLFNLNLYFCYFLKIQRKLYPLRHTI